MTNTNNSTQKSALSLKESNKTDLSQHLSKHHPCYNETAHYTISRLHLPVAQSCNIQCNFCDRRISQYYHTSRPGITSKIITPQKALKYTLEALTRDPRLKVVGIAGPGEPLYNHETFETLELLHEYAPELHLCVCTNGLLLPDKIDLLIKFGVSSITVTLNAIDPVIASRIYHHINYSDERSYGVEGNELLIRNQLTGIAAAVKNKALVKINTVLIPTINFDHILDIARKVAELGAYIMNIIPLIPLGSFSGLSEPTCEQLKLARIMAETVIPQFRLCRQCRADACGIPGLE